VQVIPQLSGDATEQTPPDLPSYLFKERIVYLGMSLVPAVTELMLAELLYLQYDNPTRPIYMYINSTGVTAVSRLMPPPPLYCRRATRSPCAPGALTLTLVCCYLAVDVQNMPARCLPSYSPSSSRPLRPLAPGAVQKGSNKIGFEAEAFAIYDTMRYIKPPVYTVCVGNAFGESAMLLAAGKAGQRAALPSASIMIRQPLQRFTQMQASDIDIYRNEIRKTNANVVHLLAKHTGHSEEETARDIMRPRYFNPYQAIDYGLIDRVLEPDDERLRAVVRSQADE
jgi:ATP-dependent Clp protease protease subunit